MSTTADQPKWLFRPLCEMPQFGTLIPQAAALVYSSGEEYFNILFGGREAALTGLRLWIAKTPSGFSHEHITLLLVNGNTGGLTLELTGRDLAALQKSDLLFLLRLMNGADRDALTRKADLVRRMTPPVAQDEYYLRSISVVEAFRGQGLGAALLENFISKGLSRGFSRFRLDVRSDNLPALNLYRKFGFRLSEDLDIPNTAWTLWSMVLERSLP